MNTDLTFRGRKILIRKDGLQSQDFNDLGQLNRLDDCFAPALDGWDVSHKKPEIIMTQEAWTKYESLIKTILTK